MQARDKKEQMHTYIYSLKHLKTVWLDGEHNINKINTGFCD